MSNDTLVPIPVSMPFRGRDISVIAPDPAQFGMLLHQSRKLERGDATGAEALRALEIMHRIVLSRLIIKEERQWVEDLIIDGDVGTLDLITLATDAFKKMAQSQEVDQKPVVRRGRPRKATS